MPRSVSLVLAAVFLLATSVPTFAQPYTADDVQNWIYAYASKYAADPETADWLADRSLRVARCETGQFDPRVINNTKLGRLKEVGTFQFLPGPGSIFWHTPTAEQGWDFWDPEANVAAAVYLINQGYGPRHWVSCWK